MILYICKLLGFITDTKPIPKYIHRDYLYGGKHYDFGKPQKSTAQTIEDLELAVEREFRQFKSRYYS